MSERNPNLEDIAPGAYDIRAVDPDTDGAIVCGTCGRAWMEDITPAGRCPWEDEHGEEITDTHFRLDIQMSSAGMQTAEDVAEILHVIANLLDSDSRTSAPIRDINGAQVGTWEYVEVAR